MYKALYRKYRPRFFKDVIGQDVTLKILQNSITENKVGHAYIFSGPRGTGKTSVAKIFAKAVNCLDPQNGDVCGKCEICKLLNTNDSDIIEIDAASNNGVDEIREIRNNAKLTPGIGKYKVYIIDEVHMLSQGAFNAILKTLEEPPAHVIFILATTEIQKIPLTILSRCQKFDFHKINDDVMEEKIKNILKEEKNTLSKEVINLIVQLSDGCCRDSINLLDQLLSLGQDNISEEDVYNLTGEVNKKIIFELLDSIIFNDYPTGLEIIKNVYEDGKNLNLIINNMLIEIRNVSINNNINNYFNETIKLNYEKYKNIEVYKLNELASMLNTLANEMKKSTMQKILFEIYFMQMCNIFKKDIVIDNQNIENETKSIESITVNEISIEAEIEKTEENYFPGNKKEIRTNNALARADKTILKEILTKYSGISEYSASKTYNNIVSILTEAKPTVCSDEYCILVFKYDSTVSLFEKNIIEAEKLLKKVVGKAYKLSALTEKEWENIKKEYIKDREKYIYIEEVIENITETSNKESKEKNVAFELFGEDVVTIK